MESSVWLFPFREASTVVVDDGEVAGRPKETEEAPASVELLLALTKSRTAPTVEARNPAVGALPRLFVGRHPPIHVSIARRVLQTAEKIQ